MMLAEKGLWRAGKYEARYMLSLKPTLVGSCLNMLRVLENPRVQTAAHIGVPGPYRRGFSDYGLAKRIKATLFTVEGANFGISDESSYAYFICKSIHLRQIWFDMEQRHFRAHITMYFGRSPRLARRMHAVMDAYQYHFSFTGENLELGMTNPPASRIPDISFDEARMSAITGIHVSLPEVRLLPFKRRIALMHRICAYLSTQATMKM